MFCLTERFLVNTLPLSMYTHTHFFLHIPGIKYQIIGSTIVEKVIINPHVYFKINKLNFQNK